MSPQSAGRSFQTSSDGDRKLCSVRRWTRGGRIRRCTKQRSRALSRAAVLRQSAPKKADASGTRPQRLPIFINGSCSVFKALFFQLRHLSIRIFDAFSGASPDEIATRSPELRLVRKKVFLPLMRTLRRGTNGTVAPRHPRHGRRTACVCERSGRWRACSLTHSLTQAGRTKSWVGGVRTVPRCSVLGAARPR